MQEALKAENLIHEYRTGKLRNRVLDGFSLSLAAGSFEALMGPSGSGKSTFLHLAAGLVSPVSGSILVGGEDIAAMSDSKAAAFRRRHIGVIYQDFNLAETLTARENILLPARLDGRKPDLDRLESLAERLGVSKALDRRPAALSGGERQRAAVARALYADPEVILADEPTGNLDIAAAHSLCELFSALHKTEKCAILLVTHDPVVAACADKVHFIKNGAVARSCDTCGDPAKVSSAYLETYK